MPPLISSHFQPRFSLDAFPWLRLGTIFVYSILMSEELNFARSILQGREWQDVPDSEILAEAERLLAAWLSGEVRMERPKLYDHYALLLLALTRQNRELQRRVSELEAQKSGSAAAPDEPTPWF